MGNSIGNLLSVYWSMNSSCFCGLEADFLSSFRQKSRSDDSDEEYERRKDLGGREKEEYKKNRC